VERGNGLKMALSSTWERRENFCVQCHPMIAVVVLASSLPSKAASPMREISSHC